MLGQQEKLQSGNLEDKLAAIKALAEVGDESCLTELSACLKDPAANRFATAAMWAIFHRHPNPDITALMQQGMALMDAGTTNTAKQRAALEVFEQVCKLEPSYAEGHNKRATVLYLMNNYNDSIEVCKLALQLNPYHFGAASGMGLCHLGNGDLKEALAAFELALSIHPGMEPTQTYVTALRAKLADDAQEQ
eukprot:GHRR01017907.1.p1 GENE.GHRR01017907.1~~GHRR01017907.1.p1  ORF type:complete len:192 (+),score=67.67 GHRR01017907.1:285-860(+)